MLHYMALRPTIVIDAEKIYALIEEQDLPPRPSRRGRGSGKRTAFAEKLGRHPGSIFNLQYVPWISLRFARQIAEGLGVEVGDLTPDGDEADGEPRKAVA